MRIRYFALLAIAALLCAGLVYPMAAQALSASCAPGASGTAAPTASPTPALISTSTCTRGTTGVLTCNLPTGLSAGNVIYAEYIGFNGSTNPPYPAGWTGIQASLSNANGAGGTALVLQHIVQAGDGATVVFNTGDGGGLPLALRHIPG